MAVLWHQLPNKRRKSITKFNLKLNRFMRNLSNLVFEFWRKQMVSKVYETD